MKFSNNLKPRAVGSYTLLAFVAIVGGGLLLMMTGLALISRAARRAGPATVVVNLPHANDAASSATPTFASLADIIGIVPVTVTPILDDPRPPTNTPTPVLRPTGYYSAPIDPTPIPTPGLPEGAPFSSSCEGPGRMNILIIGMDGRSANYDRAA